MSSKLLVRVLLLTAGLTMAVSAGSAQVYMTGRAQPEPPPPTVLKQVGIDQHLDQQLPLQLKFRDEAGHDVQLGDYFGKRPVVLSMVYYECPMLCGEVLNGMVSAFSIGKLELGKDFEVVTVSFNPKETPDLARDKKRTFVERYGKPGAEEGWHFLTGSQESIEALAKTVGFRYAWDEQTQQYAHSAGIMVATPQGKLSRYLYGVDYAPKDLRFSLIQASENKIGNIVDQVLLYCYHYDPRTGKYGAIISRALQLAGVATIVILGGFLIVMFRLEPQADRSPQGSNRGGKH